GERSPRAELPDLDAEPRRGEALHLPGEGAQHRLRPLVRDQPHADLRGRPRGDDGLGPRARIPAGDSVDLQRGTRPAALENAVPLFARRGLDPQALEVPLVTKPQLGPGAPLRLAGRLHRSIVPGDGHAGLAVLEARDDA